MENKNSNGIGAKMKGKASGDGWGKLTMWTSILIYLGFVAYSEVRGIHLFSLTIATDSTLFIFALIGIVSMGLTALVLPLFLIYKAHPGPEKTAALVFYILDLAAMISNAIIDSAIKERSFAALDPAMQGYFTYIFPALPILMGIGWAIVWHQNPEIKQREATLRLKAAVLETVREKMVGHADHKDISTQADEASEALVKQSVNEILAELGVNIRSFKELPRPPIVENRPFIPPVQRPPEDEKERRKRLQQEEERRRSANAKPASQAQVKTILNAHDKDVPPGPTPNK